MHLLEFLAGFLGLTGFLLISSGNRYGFWLGLVASVLGFALFIERGLYVMALLQVAYATVNLRALIQPKGSI